MVEMQSSNSSKRPFISDCIDCIVTLVCWTWFIFGFIFFFSWFYLGAVLFTKNTELHFQRLNSYFYQIFFLIVRTIAPRQRIEIDEKIADIRSSVIVCNHLSYLDPLLLITLFRQQKTIVKSRFFDMPIFGWIITKTGYLPASSEGRFASMMIEQMESMKSYLDAGGNFFIFPEGTRSRDGKMGKLNKGAFKIARMNRVPIYVLEISNTDKLFTPGKFFFNTRIYNNISVNIIDCIEPDSEGRQSSAAELELRVRQAFSQRQR